MKIIVNNSKSKSLIETEDASIIEVMEMFVGALIQEGYPLCIIVQGMSDKLDDLKST